MNNHTSNIEAFKETLIKSGYSANTIRAYCNAVKYYYSRFDQLDSDSLLSFRNAVLTQSPSTANLKIIAFNKYLSTIHSDLSPIKCIKNQTTSFIENVITNDEYIKLLNYLKNDLQSLYLLIRLMSSTGMRISEIMSVTYSDIMRGYMDVNSKGNKIRRVYFTELLRQEFFKIYHNNTAVLFPNRNGKPISPSGVRYQLKKYGNNIGIDKSHLHPHSFRHRFALNFIQHGGDLVMLSDILGHESIETTRIYLRTSSEEQKKLINQLVTW